MQRALRNYRTRTGIVGATVSADGESEPEWPEAGRERDWAPQRTTAPIENGSLDDTSLLPQERWWKAWSSDQEAFYYWKDGSGDTQWEDPMEDPSLENVAVRTWGGAELGCETEEDPASKGNTAPNVARDWPLANGNCTYDAVRKVMVMTGSGEEVEAREDRGGRPPEKDVTANSRPERTPEDEPPLHLEACHRCAMNEAGIDDNRVIFPEEYLGRRRLAYVDLSEAGSPPRKGRCRYCGIEGLYRESEGPGKERGDHEEDSGGTEGAGIGWDPPQAEPWLERPLATPARIGIDVGGVLKRYLDEGPRGPWEFRTDAEVPGAMAALGKCIKHFGPDNVFTLSKCRGEMRRKIDVWLTRTMRVCESPIGMRLKNILYSETRYGPQGKGAVVERLRLQLSHFVDDHDDCLCSVYEEGQSQEHVERHDGRLFHMSRGGEGRWLPEPRGWKMEDRPACVTPVRNWDEVLGYLGLDRGQ